MADWIFDASFLFESNMNICIMEYRGSGHSDGNIRTSGFLEYQDVITVIKYLKKKNFDRISYFGHSVGASIGVLLTQDFPDLVCLALDDPCWVFKEKIKKMANSHNISSKTFDIALSRVYAKIYKDLGIQLNISR